MSDEFRHRTSDHWEAAALWSRGWPIIDTEYDGQHVWFVFPDGGRTLRDAVQAHRSGRLEIPTLALREAFYQVRSMMDRELRDAGLNR